MRRVPLAMMLCLSISLPVFAQSAQMGISRADRNAQKLRIDGVHYRAAVWEKEKITEFENEFTNQGGLVYVYFTNTSDQPVSLKFFRINNKDASYWRLNHFLAWDRVYDRNVPPGASGVWELNGVTPDFAEGKAFKFSMVEQSGRTAARVESTLAQDPARISFIRVLPGMDKLEIHLRNAGKKPLKIEGLELSGATASSVEWTGDTVDGPGHAIASVTLSQPVAPATLLIARVAVSGDGEKRLVCGHRRAFADVFPIGSWNSDEENLPTLRSLHIDTGVNGGKKTNKFFSELAPKLGHNAIVHTEVPTEVETVHEFSGHPNVLCFGLADEPDWSTPPNIMLQCDQMVRKYDSTKPTFLTLCRNIKFFEYAPIADIACQDHYSVTAPSSSKWPKPYGTRLEETAWYTADLKAAAEPRPIWIWTQGIAGWGERPKRTVPTPDELAAQLVLNLGRGAKGILWFNYDRKAAEKYPDAVEAMRGWGRVMSVLREDFLACEPSVVAVKAPDQVDAALLLGRGRALLCLTNTDYDIHPEAYPFREKTNVKISADLPAWLSPADAFAVTPEGIRPVELDAGRGGATVKLDRLKACEIILITSDPNDRARCENAYNEALGREK